MNTRSDAMRIVLKRYKHFTIPLGRLRVALALDAQQMLD